MFKVLWLLSICIFTKNANDSWWCLRNLFLDRYYTLLIFIVHDKLILLRSWDFILAKHFFKRVACKVSQGDRCFTVAEISDCGEPMLLCYTLFSIVHLNLKNKCQKTWATQLNNNVEILLLSSLFKFLTIFSFCFF